VPEDGVSGGQWRSQDSKVGYSYFHINKKKISYFLTVIGENTIKYGGARLRSCFFTVLDYNK
jgi:hypothetical protein